MAKKFAIKLKPGASIGQPAAEDDHRFLSDCFIDHPAISALKDVTSSQSLLLGRTGSGKSAILWHLESSLENVTRIDPKDIAFQYIGNSAIIQEITQLGVNLHTLFEYLWMHILTLHITRECLNIRNHDSLYRIAMTLKNILMPDQNRETAIKYLEKNTDNFWLNVEQVSTEITNSIAEKLANEVRLSIHAFKVKVESGSDWKDEQKRLFRHRAQEAVSKLQMRELKATIEALSDSLDRKKNYYVLIDDLDSGWAGGADTQYALIRALIESLKTFRRIPNLKIVVAMREDLYEATLRTNTDKHFQAEKQEGVIKRLRWNDSQLIQIFEKRIDQLFRFEYTKQTVSLNDVLPEKIIQQSIRSYIIERSLRRPRDVIALVNKVLGENEGETLPLAARAVSKVEAAYSIDRLRALEDEWRSCHPSIRLYLRSLQGLGSPAQLGALDEDRLIESVLSRAELGFRASNAQVGSMAWGRPGLSERLVLNGLPSIAVMPIGNTRPILELH